MLQIRVSRFGGPEVLEPVAVPDPSPGPGQVLVRTLVAGVTFVDTQLRAGRPPWAGAPPSLPFVPGNAVAGIVSGAGDEGRARELIGRAVICSTGGSGGYAEQVVVPAGAPIVLPDTISPADGVSLLTDGRTALGLVRAADVRPGDRVLVLAAGGGVGSLLVQLVQARGAEVVAAAGSKEKLDVAAGLGADETVNYTQAGWAADLRRRIGSLSVVFDAVGGPIAAEAMSLMSPLGRYAGFGGASGRVIATEAVEGRGLRLLRATDIAASPADNRLLVESALEAAVTGDLRVVVGQQFPLTEAADAHAAIEARTTIGKTVLFC